MGHHIELCDKPRPGRRWANRLWVCHKCGQAWVAVKSITGDPSSTFVPASYETPIWQWWKWPFKEDKHG